MKNSTIKDSYNTKGLIYYDNVDYSSSGKFNIYNSSFINNGSEKGSIIHINALISSVSIISIYNSKFYNNYSSKYGGVIYSIDPGAHGYVLFEECEFENNTSAYGGIAYSLNKESEPIFKFKDSSKLNNLKSIKNMFASNPTYLNITNDSYIIDDILSGKVINNTITVNIYDDYDNKLQFGDINILSINDLIVYEIYITNDQNIIDQAEIVGQNKGYCIDDSCIIDNIKVVGIPGHYYINIKLITFGPYSEFENNKVSLGFNIIECDEANYIYQTKDHNSIKSCYKPTCNISCNTGRCVNDNVCDCSNTTFTGLFCNEHYLVNRIVFIDIIFRIIAVLLFFIVTILIIGVYKYKNFPIIKGGGYEFLILILVGIYFNCFYIIELTFRRTKLRCVLIYFFKNMGFSLVFGSILVKTLRVYIIFKFVRKSVSFKLYKMFMVIGSFVLFHLILLCAWLSFDSIKCYTFYDSNNREYVDCQYHKSNIFSMLFNTIVLLLGIWLAYSIRHVNENFQEDLVIPVYIYALFTFFCDSIDYIDDISLDFKNKMKNLSMFIYIFVILYYLYIQKFNIIFNNKSTLVSNNSIFSKKTNLKSDNLIKNYAPVNS